MFAALAALVFFLWLLHVSLGGINELALGLFLLALHFVVEVYPWRSFRRP